MITELDPALHQAARDLQFEAVADGFAKRFPTDTPHLERIYHHFAQSIEQMLLQKAGKCPVPWEDALLAFLKRIEGQKITWWLRGSAALAVRGLPLSPGDIDLTVDGSGAQQLGTRNEPK